MILSTFAAQPYSHVTKQHGESTTQLETTTFSTLPSSTSFIALRRHSNFSFKASYFFFPSSLSLNFSPSLVAGTSFFPSNSFSCHIAYSSMASTFLFLQFFKKLRTLSSFLAFSCDIIPKIGQLISTLGGMVAKPFNKLTFVVGILDLLVHTF